MTVRIAFAGFDHWYNAFPSLEQVMQASREAIEIVGTKGSLIMDSATGKMAINGEFGLNGWLLAAPPAPKGGFMRHVVRCLTGDEEPMSSVQTARDNLAACLAFYEAARTGTTVTVTPPGTSP